MPDATCNRPERTRELHKERRHLYLTRRFEHHTALRAYLTLRAEMLIRKRAQRSVITKCVESLITKCVEMLITKCVEMLITK